ncbi:membrane hypothetical protein [Hyphomicrobiales bacterium]|nr:membrane hypothetical protein [Hyphomicrobiales bacterium]CAH1690180.1 membrane hypothetical protein [Hyphomicrobiales bacterium]
MSWVAMLFAAGMGIGLMFYGVGEPMTHYLALPTAEPRSVAAVREAMSVTFLHWGIHDWAVYAVVGLSLAYFGYRYNLPLTIRSGLYPLLKERINGPISHAVDIFAISRGRGVREFISAVLFIPEFFTYLPVPAVTSTLAILLVAIFFVTSADSASLVIDAIAAGGETETTTLQRVFWCAFSGLVAVLLPAGGLAALQSVTIAGALPFVVVILALLWSQLVGMRADGAQQLANRSVAAAIPAYPAAGDAWQRHLDLMLYAHGRKKCNPSSPIRFAQR